MRRGWILLLIPGLAHADPERIRTLVYGARALEKVAVEDGGVWVTTREGKRLRVVDAATRRSDAAAVAPDKLVEGAAPVSWASDGERVYWIEAGGAALVSVEARRPAAEDVWFGDEAPPETGRMRRVPGGEGELPAHHSEDVVELPAFDVDVRPVTRAEYLVCVDHGACLPPGDWWASRRGPAEVTGERARAYCRFAGKRLPERFEWPLVVAAWKLDEDVWLSDRGFPMTVKGEQQDRPTERVRCAR